MLYRKITMGVWYNARNTYSSKNLICFYNSTTLLCYNDFLLQIVAVIQRVQILGNAMKVGNVNAKLILVVSNVIDVFMVIMVQCLYFLIAGH